VIGTRVRRAVMAGAKLIVVDPTRIWRYADLYLQPRPGISLLLGMARVIVDELHDLDFIRSVARISGLGSLEPYNWTTWGSRDQSRADLPGGVFARKPAAILYGMGSPILPMARRRNDGGDLAMLTGSVGKPGVNPLRGRTVSSLGGLLIFGFV
jgi:formate dehydrogenase major subunit